MTDSTLNRFLASGTNAERLAFTPSPPTPASGPDPTYVWHETDTSNTYCWNFDSSAWIKINNAPTSTTPNAVTFNNSGSGAASGTNFDGSAAQTISYNTLGAQPSDATLTALSAVAWSAGTQVLTLTAADTFTLKTVGIAAGNILDKTAGDTLYQPVGSYQPSDATLTALAGLSWSAGTQVPVFTAADTVSFKTIGSSTGNILDKAAGDSLYQPLDGTLTAVAGLTYTSGTLIPALTASDTFALKAVGSASGNILDKAAGDALYQPLDGDLTAIAALSGTNNLYYRSAANTWSSVTFGTVLSFTGGALSVTSAKEWAPNFTAAGDLYIPAIVAMTVDQGNAAIGTGTLAYSKSTAAAPSTFTSTTLPATLEAGAWLKVTASSVTGFVATHLKRTA